MPTTFKPAAEVREIAEELIPEHHGHLDDEDVTLLYVFRDDVPTSNGREVWGKASKLSGKTCFLAFREQLAETGEEPPQQAFLIEISEPVWSKLKADQRRALVDHELMHCQAEYEDGAEGEPPQLKLSVKAHDLEVFNAEYLRHGDWKRDIRTFADLVKR